MLAVDRKPGGLVFLYAKRKDDTGTRLQRVVETFVPGVNLEIFRNFNKLTQRLKQPGGPVDISILMTGTRKELSDFSTIQDLLSDSRVIIILPDRKKETIAMGHSFRPRFITYSDSDFVEVGAVLNRMMANTNRNKGKWLQRNHNLMP